MERIWQDYRASGAFRALALDCGNGGTSALQSFIERTGTTFPVLRDAAFVQRLYAVPYENYVVVDREGIVRYVSVWDDSYTGPGRFNDVHLRAVIEEYLVVGVEPQSWTGIKELYR